MQTALLNRRRWTTRIELANAIFEYLEIFHNRQRRHSAVGMLTPIEYELRADRDRGSDRPGAGARRRKVRGVRGMRDGRGSAPIRALLRSSRPKWTAAGIGGCAHRRAPFEADLTGKRNDE
jgi:hypothetical protein